MMGEQRITARQADILTAATGTLVGDFASFQLYAEKLLGRPILTHEFADRETWAELKEAARSDLLAIVPLTALEADA
jgi:hypothetical protein